MTNHHCARSCLEQLSKPNTDLDAVGYYPRTETDDLKCPDVEADQLLEIIPVTDRVNRATKDKSGHDFSDAEKVVIAEITGECSRGTEIRCDVVKLYHGGHYDAYRYRRFQDVRLVFAPDS